MSERPPRLISADTLRPSMRTPAPAPSAASPCGLCPNIAEGECQQPACDPTPVPPAAAPPSAQAYGAEYYRSANYRHYEERRDRYLQTARELAELLRRLGLLDRTSRIIDYGCALGYLLEGFHLAGYHAEGVEVSDWAREAAPASLRIYGDARQVHGPVEVLVALDVFEHMQDSEVREVLQFLRPRALVVRVPCSTDGGRSFHLAVSRQDPTHINCKEKAQWEELLRALGYETLRLSLHTVYDSAGVACLLGLRRAS